MKIQKIIILATVLLGWMGLTSAAQEASTPSNTVTTAKVTLAPTQGNTASGTVTFTQAPNGVKITGLITGLTPGKHGFHIHEFGDCSAADAASAGGHFNPTHMMHGAPDAVAHHEGDMGNLIADSTGKAQYEYLDNSMYLQGADSILGRSVIVHEKVDDLTTQPTGNSGARVACGVIGAVK
jgi:Cu-Zn family superoxide dismutase